MARTRRQVTLQEQESGVPPSPPQSLPTTTRPTRAKRTITRNNATTAPADPPSSTQGGPAVRGARIGRAKKVIRRRAQQLATINHDIPESSAIDVDPLEASDSSTHREIAIQASPTIRTVFDDEKEVEDMEELDVEPPGETQFPSGVSAHPVQVQDMTAHPVQGSPTPQERRESATSQVFRDILGDNLRSPIPSPGPLTPSADAPVVPSSSTFKTPSGLPTPDRVAPLSSSPSFKPVPQIPKFASEPTIYYVPSNPERSHTLITLHMDHIQGSKDPVRPSKPAAFAVPSELVAPLCRYIESRAKPGSDLSKLTTEHPDVKTIVQGDARYRPQLPSWQSQQSPPPPGSTMRDAFIRKAQRKRGFREMEEETATLQAENAKLKANAARTSPPSTLQKERNEAFKSTESPRKRTKIVPDPYTADGQLLLGRTKEIEVDQYGVAVNPTDEPSLRWSKYILDPIPMPCLGFNEILDDMEARKKAQLEEARRAANVVDSPYVAEESPNTDGPALGGLLAESQDQVQLEQVPETPRARGWGLSKFLPSARSVTKYIPFSSRRAIPTPQHQSPQPQHIAQTETRTNTASSQLQPDTEIATPVAGPSHRRHQSTSNQQRLLTKEQSEEEKRIKRMRAELRREAEALEKQKKDLEIAKKDLAEQRKSADIAETPRQKRKRMPSPDIIPLPATGGFGMVDEYFIVDSSSDEEDAAAQETPIKERPLKKARTSAPDSAIVGSPFRARPYTGTLFAHPDALRSRQDENVFAETDEPDASSALDSTPPPGPTLTFKVPSPGSSDSDDDEDDEQGQVNETTQEASSSSAPETRSILRNSPLHSNQAQSRSSANSPSPSKPMGPPPHPNSGHTSLPAATGMTPSVALEKAREKALRHQPKQPSTLRESSRLSSSTVSSDFGDEDVEGYDPAHPAIVPSPSKVPVFGQPATPPAPASRQPVASPTAPLEFQQPVTQPVSEQKHEQQAVHNTSGKQAENMFEVSAATHADDVRSSGHQAVPSKKQNEVLSDADQFIANLSPKIKADMDRYWEEHGDDYVLDDGYEEFQREMLAEEQELMDGPNGHPYSQPHNIVSAALDRIGADGLADRGIQTDIEDNWRPGDLERTESDPKKGMKAFFNRLVKNGDIEEELADRVIAMGVPPGTTEYLAGQGVTGPVAT